MNSPVGVGIRAVRGVEVASIMKTAGFDWLFIDLEHGSTSIETAASISVAARFSRYSAAGPCATR